MIVDLVRTVTADGMRLDGALHLPPDGVAAQTDIDVLICLHGVGSNFYSSRLLEEITPSLLNLGVAVLWVNTRGHDGLNTAITTGRRKRQGAAYEIVDECRLDIAAWLGYVVERGFSRVGLFGHSLGAIKVLYATAHEPHPSVRRIVAASPPRLSFAAFSASQKSAEYIDILTTAERHVAAGQPDTLLDVRFPFPLLITAECYVDKYGRAERYNLTRWVDRLSVPTLFTYGSIELATGGVAFAGLPEILLSTPGHEQREIVTVVGADHFYSGVYHRLADEVRGWFQRSRS